MISPGRFLAGFGVLTIVFALVALLSDAPAYRAIAPQTGVLKLSFSHGADRKAGCRKLSAEEMAAIAALNIDRRFNDPGDFGEAAFGTFLPIYE